MLPLSMVEPGRRVEIVEIRAGRGLTMRLANMGFYRKYSLTAYSLDEGV